MTIRRNTFRQAPSIFIILLWALIPQEVRAAPDLIAYQGRLTDTIGLSVPDSLYTVVFALYADSIGGASLWDENDSISTRDGLFSHMLGSATALPQSIFQDNDKLFLEITVEGETALPRTRLASVPYAQVAGNLTVKDVNDSIAVQTRADSHQMAIYGFEGEVNIALRGGIIGDDAAELPDSAINSMEILDEPGIVVSNSAYLIPLTTGTMIDLVTVEITIPADGYILLHGKCYVLLSGTTGPNTARVQIDENEGGSPQFPYYTVAGLGGYVNTTTNYFPVYVTKTFYKSEGTYTFRMEGQAVDPPPAEAKTWDHILTAVYYPTGYGGVKSIVAGSGDRPDAVFIPVGDSAHTGSARTYREEDLRDYEMKAKTAEKDSKQD
jgi:hypothetical protein